MFDEPPSLPMRAAIASLLGGLFGIALILSTHSAQAQAQAQAQTQTQTATVTAASRTSVAAIDRGLERLGEAALQALRAAEPLYGLSSPGSHFVRLTGSASEPASGLRWQVTRMPGFRSEGEIPRRRDLVSLGVQVRF